MSKEPGLNQMFEPYSEGLNLIGFPEIPVIDDLARMLGREVLLEGHKTEIRGKKACYPIFDSRLIEKRQAFFRRLRSSRRIQKTFFEKGIPDPIDLSEYRSYIHFVDLCREVYETLETARTELKPFKHLPEARRILRRVNSFDSRLEKMLKALKEIEENKAFAFDIEEGVIAFLSGMPGGVRSVQSRNLNSSDMNEELDTLRLKAERTVMRIAKKIGLSFQKDIFQFVRDEFRFHPGKENLRKDYERIAVPIRFHSRYNDFLTSCLEYDPDWIIDGHEYSDPEVDIGIFGKFVNGLSTAGKDFVNQPIQAKFSNYFNIKGLFPPKLMCYGEIDVPFIPLDFVTKTSEKKILMAGLHSGSKSFYLDNLVATLILAATGEFLPAESLILPKYNKIFFYRNLEPSRGGKLQSELICLDYMIRESEEGDAIFIDEFLDSAAPDIASELGPLILNRLLKETKATVIVTSHRCSEYRSLTRKGWTIMTPDYEERDGEIVPAKRLRKGYPKPEINMMYAEQIYKSISR